MKRKERNESASGLTFLCLEDRSRVILFHVPRVTANGVNQPNMRDPLSARPY